MSWASSPIGILCQRTGLGSHKAAYLEKLDEYVRGYLIRQPNYSIGDHKEDEGNVVVFLASKYSRYMTGRTLFADDGKSFYR